MENSDGHYKILGLFALNLNRSKNIQMTIRTFLKFNCKFSFNRKKIFLKWPKNQFIPKLIDYLIIIRF